VTEDDFRAVYERHVGHVVAGDHKATLADMVPEKLPTVFQGVTVPRSAVTGHEIRQVRADRDLRIGETVYRTADGPIGLRSIWERRGERWLAAALENFPADDDGASDEPWGPSPDGLDQPYWDGLARAELLVQRCGRCQTWIWGPQWICGSCHAFDPWWQRVEPVGTVYSWSRTWRPFIDELHVDVPYVTIVVELPAAGNRRVLGLLTGSDSVRIGDRVTGVFEHDEGARWPMLRWQPVEAAA